MLINIFLGSFALSVLHAIIPNHWMPMVVIGKTEGWSRAKHARVALLAGFAHTASSILLGIFVGILGIQLTQASMETMLLVAPSVILLFGILYVISGIRDNIRKHEHRHLHLDKAVKKSGKATIISLSLAMFFSPCIEIETYFFNASLAGWAGIVVVGLTYLIVTVTGISVMVELGRRGAELVKLKFLEHYEKHIMGSVLILMALAFYFFHDF